MLWGSLLTIFKDVGMGNLPNGLGCTVSGEGKRKCFLLRGKIIRLYFGRYVRVCQYPVVLNPEYLVTLYFVSMLLHQTF